MLPSVPHAPRLAAVEAGFRSLPERYLGAEPGFDATWRIVLGDVGHTWEVRCTTHGARARKGATGRTPDVVIGTDADTWIALRRGELSGIDAFGQRRLYARGNLDLAVAFEGMFRQENGRRPLLRIHEVRLPGRRVSTLTMGAGPDVLLIHGLGGAKSSFFDTAAGLSHRYRVHALDLPGFGSSSKPATAPYTARYFAERVVDVMDELGIERAHLVGNSMGGRVAIEVGLRQPERVRGLALLCPAVAFVRRDYHPIVRMLRPELGLLPHKLTRGMVESTFWSLFCDPDSIDPSMADIVVEEFQRIYGTAGGRFAFLAAARNIYLDRPYGRGGFYPRLSELAAPSLFVWGTHDRLIPAAFKRHVEHWLPRAGQIVLERCGHVPQVERAEQVNGLLERFFGRVDALGDAPGATQRIDLAA
ncbi:MAG TPA: alpha/beta fold hydrolase [Solirubrobacteraceae bacterium]|nr:alpha/beta fold hydrolase [Solirubrobacteraceae bacterium]